MTMMTMSTFDNTRIEEVVTTFLRIAPAFAQDWNEHLTFWGGEPRGQYNDTAEIARFVVLSFKRGNTNWFPEFFAEIEDWLKRDDPALADLLTVGLLEDIQTVSSHETFGSAVFEQWLGPVTKSHWLRTRQMWQGKSSLMDVVRAEKQAQQRRGGGHCA
jgi:hypothetical protein